MKSLSAGMALSAAAVLGAGLVPAAVVSATPSAAESVTIAVQPTAATDALDLAAGIAADTGTPWFDEIIGFGQIQISDSFEYLAAGELTIAMALFSTGMANIMVYAPQAGLMATVDDAFGQDILWRYLPYGYPFSESYLQDLDDVFAFVQDRFESGFESISLGLEELADGQFNWGLFDLLWGIDEMTVNLGLGLLISPMAMLDPLGDD